MKKGKTRPPRLVGFYFYFHFYHCGAVFNVDSLMDIPLGLVFDDRSFSSSYITFFLVDTFRDIYCTA